MIRRSIQVTFQKEGIHCYPAALTDPALKEVSYLGNPHRHIFHFYVTIEVFHNDREIEFILFKQWLQGLFSGEVMDIDFKSCEMLAEELIGIITSQYPARDIAVAVYEDDENGAILEYCKE